MNNPLVLTVLGPTRPSKRLSRIPTLNSSDFDFVQCSRALLLDLRPAAVFAAAFIPGSVNVPKFQSPEVLVLAGLVGRRSVYLVTDSEDGLAASAAKFFAHFEDMPVLGWFSPAVINQWRRVYGPTPSIEYIQPDTLAVRVAAWKTTVVDFRGDAAFRSAHIPDSLQLPLKSAVTALAGLPFTTSLSLICESGMQCSFAASLLWNAGYRNLAIVAGGFAAYNEQRLPLARS